MKASRILKLGLWSFLMLFLLLPLLGLLTAAFVGEQAPFLSWLYRGDLGALFALFAESFSLQFFAEFFTTPRYYRGFFNAVGLAPFLLTLSFLAILSGEKLGLVDAELGKRMKGPGLLALLILLAALAVLRPWWASPDSMIGKILYGQTALERILQLCGYCPVVTLISGLIGGSIAFCLYSTNMPAKKFVTLLVVVPLSMPPFLGALAFKNLLGDFGMLTRLFEELGLSHPFVGQSPISAALVESFLFFPFVTLTTMAALERFDRSLPQASQVMGGSKMYGFLTVTLPTLMPGILAGAFLVFVRSFGDFATLKLLLPTQYSMIIVEAYRDYAGSSYWGGAAMLSTLMIIVILVLLALQKYVVEGGSYQTVDGRSGNKELANEPRQFKDYLALLYSLAIFSVPLAFLGSTFLVSIARNWGAQVVPDQFTLKRYQNILKSALTEYDSPLVNSFSLTIPALLACLVVAFLVAYFISRGSGWSSQVLDFATILPFVIPGVAFAVALIGVFNEQPFLLHNTPYLVIIAYVVTRAPYAVRTVLASFQQIGISMEESSRTLGGSEFLTLSRVTVPLVMPGILAGSVMVFISCMQDVAITLMISPADWFPTSVDVFRSIERGRIYDASAYGIVLFFLILVPYSVAFFSKRLGLRAGL